MHLLMDMDDVLIKSSYMSEEGKLNFYWSDNIEADLGIKKNTLSILFNEDWNNVIIGRKSIYQQVEEYLSTIHCSLSSHDFISYWISKDSQLNEEVANFAREIHKQGCSLYIGANQENIRVCAIVEKYKEFFSIFKKIYTSASIGVKKPDRRFFEYILSDLRLFPNELFFIDDSSKNIISATQLGIVGFEYKNGSQITNIANDMILKRGIEL